MKHKTLSIKPSTLGLRAARWLLKGSVNWKNINNKWLSKMVAPVR